jgi:predicted lipoprotein with Yx(FWY)xxD motif
MRPKTLLTMALVVPLLALTVAACGGSDNNPPAGAAAPRTNSGAKTATIGVANSSLGKILVDSQGRTVYLFEKDTGTTSTCSGDCAVAWPPVTVDGKATVGNGLTASKVGTTKRSDGTSQVTYNGHPLYLFQGDHGSGDTNGEGLNAFGALWYVVAPTGAAVTSSPAGNGGNGY